jgi:hypothetical protein
MLHLTGHECRLRDKRSAKSRRERCATARDPADPSAAKPVMSTPDGT